jgi:DNA primase large subunit
VSFVSSRDFAKYPFTAEAGQRIKAVNLSLEDLASDDSQSYLDQAISRIKQAIVDGRIPVESTLAEVDVLAYPIALLLVSILCGEGTRRRYALAEGKRGYQLLRMEPADKLQQIATRNFGWRSKQVDVDVGNSHFSLALHFKDYIRNAAKIHDLRWELINRVLMTGYVLLTTDDFARLLEEEVQARVLERTRDKLNVTLPGTVEAKVSLLRPILEAWERRFSFDKMPHEALMAALPPCMKNLLSILQTSRHMPHMGNFALAAFLLNIGLTEEEALKLFMALTDFDERIARYQIEHIAGRHGSRTKYTAPNCPKMRMHGLCINPDELCATVTHPLSYYRRKARFMQREGKKPYGTTVRLPKK